jgi:amino acid transporter
MRSSTADRAGREQMGRSDARRPPTLVRAIGRRDLSAAVVNAVIGTGVFALPSAVATLTGSWSPAAVLLAGLGMFPIVLCVAEVGSRFDAAGGPYLYAREAFGPATGFQVGWLLVWTRLFSGAAVLNVLTAYLANLAPWVGTPAGRTVAMTTAMALVTAVNVLGVRQAAWTVNLFTIAKLLPLVLVIVLGVIHLRDDVLAEQRVAAPDWTEAVLLMVFAYGGFEVALVAAGETRRPREDTAFAVVAGMVVVTAVYSLTQLAVVGVLPHAAASKAPVADALRATLGAVGAAVGGVAAVVSAYGWLMGFALLIPRVLFSMAERGELPTALGRVHPAFRTPHVAVVACSLAALGLGLAGTFTGAATLSAIGRLVVYAVTCAALVALRRRGGAPAGFVLPGGLGFAVLGVAFSVWLLSTRSLAQGWGVAAIVAVGVVVWWRMQRRRRTAPGGPSSLVA